MVLQCLFYCFFKFSATELAKWLIYQKGKNSCCVSLTMVGGEKDWFWNGHSMHTYNLPHPHTHSDAYSHSPMTLLKLNRVNSSRVFLWVNTSKVLRIHHSWAMEMPSFLLSQKTYQYPWLLSFSYSLHYYRCCWLYQGTHIQNPVISQVFWTFILSCVCISCH